MPVLPNQTQDLIPGVGAGTVAPIDTTGGIKVVTPDMRGFVSLARHFQKEQDDVAIDNAKADVERYITETTFGVPDKDGVLQGGWMNLHGRNALEPDDDGKGLSQRVDEGLASKINEVGSTLSSEARRRFMDNYAIQRRHDVYNSTSRFVLQQNDIYKKSSAEGNIRSAQQNVAVSVMDPDSFDRNLAIVADNTRIYGARMGLSAEDTNSQVKINQSKAIVSGLNHMLELAGRVPDYANRALGILNQYSSKMLADDVVKVRDQINRVLDENEATLVTQKGADDLVTKARAFGKGVFASNGGKSAGGLFSIITGLESNNQQFDARTGLTIVGKNPDGTFPEIGMRAYGVSQIQVRTARDAAKSLGIPFDEKRLMTDREYNYSLGFAHFSNLVSRYGDPDLAAAAYHQGVGNVDKALQKARKEGGVWINYIGKAGQDYVAKFRKKRQSSLSGEVSGVNIFSPDGFKKYGQAVTREQCYGYVMANVARANVNPTYAMQLTDSLYGEVQKRERDEKTRLLNGANAIMNYAVENNFDLTNIPLRLKNEVNPYVLSQLETRIGALRNKDTSGDRKLAVTLMNDDAMLLNMEDPSFNLVLYSLPADMRQKVQDRRWALQAKANLAQHGKAVDTRNAQQGVYNPKNVIKDTEARRFLSSAMGTEEWKKLDKNQQDFATANFMIYYGENQTTDERANNDIESLNVAKRFLSTEFDTGFVFTSNKNYLELKIGDLPSGAVGNVREICTALAKEANRANRVDREPTDQEVVDAFIRLDSLRYPSISGLDQTMLSNDRVNYIVKTYRETHNGKLPNDVEIVKYYVRSIMRGEEVPTVAPSNRVGDPFYTAIDNVGGLE